MGQSLPKVLWQVIDLEAVRKPPDADTLPARSRDYDNLRHSRNANSIRATADVGTAAKLDRSDTLPRRHEERTRRTSQHLVASLHEALAQSEHVIFDSQRVRSDIGTAPIISRPVMPQQSLRWHQHKCSANAPPESG